LLLEETQT